MSDVDDLLAHARSRSVAVIGGGIAGLVAARELAKVAVGVTVYEASDRFGGVIRSEEIGGVVVDVGADGFRAGRHALQVLIDDLGLADARRMDAAPTRWLVGRTAAPLPGDTIAGVPANPFAEDVRSVIGWRGAWRAYVDRLRPPLTIGHQHSLGRLVRGRMGATVVDRMVAPLTRAHDLAEPDEIDVETVAPGLGAALTRTGSLSGAVRELLETTERPALATVDGGMTRLVEALVGALRDLEVDLRTASAVSAIVRDGDGWRIGDERYDHVVIATDESGARRLLDGLVTDLGPRQDVGVAVVTLVTAAPTSQRGGGAYPVETATDDAHAVLIADLPAARWGVGPPDGSAIVRVQLLADGETDDERLIALATVAAATLVDATAVRDARVDRFARAASASRLGHTERTTRIRASVGAVGALSVVGAWAAGAELGVVVRDATAEADRVRHALLWDSGQADA